MAETPLSISAKVAQLISGEYSRAQYKSEIEQLIKMMNSLFKESDLVVEFIKMLGEPLVDANPVSRNRAIVLLETFTQCALSPTSILNQSSTSESNTTFFTPAESSSLNSKTQKSPQPFSLLNQDHQSYFISFYCARLQDTPCIPNVVQALETLILNSSTLIGQDLHVLFCHLHNLQVTSQPFQVRNSIFKMYFYIFKNFLDVLLSVPNSKDFTPLAPKDIVWGIANMIQGEADPRNLKLTFSILFFIFHKFPKESWSICIETLFASIACYFPLTFRNTNQPNSGRVAQETLRIYLSLLLSSTVDMSLLSIPFLINKLTESSDPSIWLQVYQVLYFIFHFHSIQDIGEEPYLLSFHAFNEKILEKDPPVPDFECIDIFHIWELSLSDYDQRYWGPIACLQQLLTQNSSLIEFSIDKKFPVYTQSGESCVESSGVLSNNTLDPVYESLSILEKQIHQIFSAVLENNVNSTEYVRLFKATCCVSSTLTSRLATQFFHQIVKHLMWLEAFVASATLLDPTILSPYLSQILKRCGSVWTRYTILIMFHLSQSNLLTPELKKSFIQKLYQSFMYSKIYQSHFDMVKAAQSCFLLLPIDYVVVETCIKQLESEWIIENLEFLSLYLTLHESSLETKKIVPFLIQLSSKVMILMKDNHPMQLVSISSLIEICLNPKSHSLELFNHILLLLHIHIFRLDEETTDTFVLFLQDYENDIDFSKLVNLIPDPSKNKKSFLNFLKIWSWINQRQNEQQISHFIHQIIHFKVDDILIANSVAHYLYTFYFSKPKHSLTIENCCHIFYDDDTQIQEPNCWNIKAGYAKALALSKKSDLIPLLTFLTSNFTIDTLKIWSFIFGDISWKPQCLGWFRFYKQKIFQLSLPRLLESVVEPQLVENHLLTPAENTRNFSFIRWNQFSSISIILLQMKHLQPQVWMDQISLLFPLLIKILHPQFVLFSCLWLTIPPFFQIEHKQMDLKQMDLKQMDQMDNTHLINQMAQTNQKNSSPSSINNINLKDTVQNNLNSLNLNSTSSDSVVSNHNIDIFIQEVIAFDNQAKLNFTFILSILLDKAFRYSQGEKNPLSQSCWHLLFSHFHSLIKYLCSCLLQWTPITNSTDFPPLYLAYSSPPDLLRKPQIFGLVRARALACLGRVADIFEPHVLLPVKSSVEDAFKQGINDSKRNVREVARIAQQRWRSL